MFTYTWEVCEINTDQWARMIERRNSSGWEMISVNVIPGTAPITAYVFWKSKL